MCDWQFASSKLSGKTPTGIPTQAMIHLPVRLGFQKRCKHETA